MRKNLDFVICCRAGALLLTCLAAACKPQLRSELICDTQKHGSSTASPPVVKFDLSDGGPENIVLESSSGKLVEGRILAKYGHEILFRRASDKREFTMELETLSTDHQLTLAEVEDFEIEKLFRPKSRALLPKAQRYSFGFQKPFFDDDEEAIAASKRSGKPVLLVFTGSNSFDPNDEDSMIDAEVSERETASFMRTVFGDRRFRSLVGDNFEGVHIDLSDEDNLRKDVKRRFHQIFNEYEVNRLPCLIVLNAAGHQKIRIEGYDSRGPNLIIDRLEAASETEQR